MIFLALDMMSDFQLYPGHFYYYVVILQVLLKSLILAGSHLFRFSMQFWPTLGESGVNDSLIFRTSAVFFGMLGFSGVAGTPLVPGGVA